MAPYFFEKILDIPFSSQNSLIHKNHFILYRMHYAPMNTPRSHLNQQGNVVVVENVTQPPSNNFPWGAVCRVPCKQTKTTTNYSGYEIATFIIVFLRHLFFFISTFDVWFDVLSVCFSLVFGSVWFVVRIFCSV